MFSYITIIKYVSILLNEINKITSHLIILLYYFKQNLFLLSRFNVNVVNILYRC